MLSSEIRRYLVFLGFRCSAAPTQSHRPDVSWPWRCRGGLSGLVGGQRGRVRARRHRQSAQEHHRINFGKSHFSRFFEIFGIFRISAPGPLLTLTASHVIQLAEECRRRPPGSPHGLPRPGIHPRGCPQPIKTLWGGRGRPRGALRRPVVKKLFLQLVDNF